MNETKAKVSHTPGPWTEDGCTRTLEIEVDLLELRGQRVSTVKSGEKVIALVFDDVGLDARLIAAAPEMLDALKTSIETAERIDEPGGFERAKEAKRKTLSAIKKAQGRA